MNIATYVAIYVPTYVVCIFVHSTMYVFIVFLKDCGESNDTVTLEGPVSDHSLFQSGFADSINPDT